MDIIGYDFIPPHCPRANCKAHFKYDHANQWIKWTTYKTKGRPKRIQRFLCKVCGGTYSRQAFSTTYWQKLPDLDQRLFLATNEGMCNSQFARYKGVSPSTVDRHLARLGRHCMLFHLKMIKDLPPPAAIVVDGFETFEHSQYAPMHFNVAVDKEDHFFWYFNDSPLRRKGRMTDFQKQKRTEMELILGRPDPKAIEKDMHEVIEVTLRGAAAAIVFSDKHPAYPKSINRIDCQIEHITVSSKDPRTPHNNLFNANLVDLLFRHGSANHRRETIAFSKRRQSGAERAAIFLVWRNYVKGISERKRGSPTPAILKGLTTKRLVPEEILDQRLFPAHLELPPRWVEYYNRAVETAALSVNSRHELKFAY